MTLPARGSTGIDLRGLRIDSPIEIECGDGTITMSVQTVLDWVAPGAPPQDAMRFLMICRNARLNPLLGEAFLLPMGKQEIRYQVVFPRAAYLKRAQEHPDYDGHESGITVWTGNDFGDVPGLIRPPVANLPVVGGWARVWRKGIDHPVYKRVSLDEYRKQTHIWQNIPNTMIAKVALVAALREAFSLSGYDESEADRELPGVGRQPPGVGAAPAVRFPTALPSAVITTNEPVIDVRTENVPALSCRNDDTIGRVNPALVGKITDLAGRLEISDEAFASLLARRGVDSTFRLTVIQAEEVIARMETVLRERDAAEVFGPAGPGVEVPTDRKPEPIVLGEPAEQVLLPDVSRRGEPVSAEASA